MNKNKLSWSVTNSLKNNKNSSKPNRKVIQDIEIIRAPCDVDNTLKKKLRTYYPLVLRMILGTTSTVIEISWSFFHLQKQTLQNLKTNHYQDMMISHVVLSKNSTHFW